MQPRRGQLYTSPRRFRPPLLHPSTSLQLSSFFFANPYSCEDNNGPCDHWGVAWVGAFRIDKDNKKGFRWINHLPGFWETRIEFEGGPPYSAWFTKEKSPIPETGHGHAAVTSEPNNHCGGQVMMAFVHK